MGYEFWRRGSTLINLRFIRTLVFTVALNIVLIVGTVVMLVVGGTAKNYAFILPVLMAVCDLILIPSLIFYRRQYKKALQEEGGNGGNPQTNN